MLKVLLIVSLLYLTKADPDHTAAEMLKSLSNHSMRAFHHHKHTVVSVNGSRLRHHHHGAKLSPKAGATAAAVASISEELSHVITAVRLASRLCQAGAA